MTTQAYEQQIEDSDDEEYEPTEQGMLKKYIQNQTFNDSNHVCLPF